MENFKFDVAELSDLFTCIGLVNLGGDQYKERIRKHRQVFDYIIQVEAALRKLSTKRPIIFLDCGCGKSYLSFIVNQYCTEVLKRDVYFIGVDWNEKLVQNCADTAKTLGLKNMEFHYSDILKFVPDKKIDIVYSLHACDTGTDMTIAKGIIEDARFIMSVSCCQHTSRKQMDKHPLGKITRFTDYRERLVDMVGDSMRGLLLESLGYRIHLFEFVPSSATPKNIMLKAEKRPTTGAKAEEALRGYKKLLNIFHIRPTLETYIESYLEEAVEIYATELKGKNGLYIKGV